MVPIVGEVLGETFSCWERRRMSVGVSRFFPECGFSVPGCLEKEDVGRIPRWKLFLSPDSVRVPILEEVLGKTFCRWDSQWEGVMKLNVRKKANIEWTRDDTRDDTRGDVGVEDVQASLWYSNVHLPFAPCACFGRVCVWFGIGGHLKGAGLS